MNNIDLLKDLTQTTYDSVEGYRQAAEKAESPALVEALRRRSGERSLTLEKLNNALQQQGEEPISSISMSGSAHQMFLTITEAFSDGNDAAVERVEEGEEYLAEQFRDALEKDDLDTDFRMLIETAYREVREGERFSEMLEKQYA